MTSYSKEVIADLVAGTLPWPQTRRIMSAYKDDDRFFKYVAVLQDRVGWQDPILLPVGDHLFICQSGDERVTKCECGHSFGDYRKNWKLKASIIVRDSEESLREIYPNSDLPDPSVVGQSVTVAASVAVTSPGSGTPTGSAPRGSRRCG